MSRQMFWILAVTIGFVFTETSRAATPVADEAVKQEKTPIVVPPPTSGGATDEPGGTKTASDVPDVLRFRNADLLHGALVSVTPTDGVRWNHPQAKSQLAFGLEGLNDIQLGAAAKPRAGTRALVQLTNGDSLAGDLVALTADALTLQTWYAGAVTIKRNMIAGLRPNTGVSAGLYTGPNNMAEWERANNRGNVSGWTFRKGALISAGGGGYAIGRDLKLPDMVSIECDLAWQGYPGFFMLFYVENFDDYYNTECYALQISGNSINLQRSKRGQGLRPIESGINLETLQPKGKAHMALKINKPKHTLALFLDDKLVKQWTDNAEFAGKGTGLGFVAQGQPTRISNITVSEWDGRLDIDNAGKSEEEDFVRLINNDKLSGKLGPIAKGQVAFTTSFATMQIPLERVVEIILGSKDSVRARRQTNDIYAYFADGNRLTLALERLDNQQLTGSSENCGKMVAQRPAFQRLQFNIYEPKPDGDDDDEWGATNPRSGQGGRGMIIRD